MEFSTLTSRLHICNNLKIIEKVWNFPSPPFLLFDGTAIDECFHNLNRSYHQNFILIGSKTVNKDWWKCINKQIFSKENFLLYMVPFSCRISHLCCHSSGCIFNFFREFLERISRHLISVLEIFTRRKIWNLPIEILREGRFFDQIQAYDIVSLLTIFHIFQNTHCIMSSINFWNHYEVDKF